MSDEAADSPPRQRSEPAGLVRMTEQSGLVSVRLLDAADAYLVARSPRKDSGHTTAAYRRDLRLLSGIIAAHLGVEVAELGVGRVGQRHRDRGGLLGHPDQAGRLGSLAGRAVCGLVRHASHPSRQRP